jgi:hypothetical protein
MVRAALVVSVAQRTRARASGFGRAVPAPSATTANGGWPGTQCNAERTERAAAGPATLVRNALVVPAGRHRDNAASDDPSGASRYDTPTAADHAGYDAASTSGGHVFCLTAPMMMSANR